MDYRILGPVEVCDEARTVALAGARQRALLAILLVHANEVVSADRLIDDLWGARPPPAAVKALHAYVSRLRKAFADHDSARADGPLLTRGHGYLLRVEPGELDLDRFRASLEDGRQALAAGNADQAARVLRAGLELWRGPPLADFTYESFAQSAIAQLEELRLEALEERAEADLALGRAGQLVGELATLVEQNPLRERLRAQLMLALYRAGRVAEALASYQEFRRGLSDQLGLEPGPRLQQLELAILNRDPSLGEQAAKMAHLAPAPGQPTSVRPAEQVVAPDRQGVSPAQRQVRKVVTALFCDVVGSTPLGEELDPEVLRGVMNRYFAEMRAAIERHGGTVEKFAGDAVMAVFGIPRVHEDDALRAVRAAAEIRERMPAVAHEVGMTLRWRTGVNTGLVVTGEGENLAIGDAVNVAARLEQAAEPGEIVLGAETVRLVRGAVEVGEARLLELKGKAEPVATYPLLAVSGEPQRRFATAMVGRENELARLGNVFAQAVQDRSCQLFTVLGSAGVGKSRLVAEFLAGMEAQVVRGLCLSYGEGITYWPVVEILKQLGTLPAGDAARPLRSLLGETDESGSSEEIAWGFRKLLEQEAQQRPLVCVFDDLHWAEETLLDLVEHVGDLARDAPIVLLGMARPELLERRPSWGGGKWNATTILLEPLGTAEAEQLLGELGGVPRELHERIVRAAEGNPLFLEEMLALVRDSGGERVEVPPTIQALLVARLDQLDPAERAVLERGSVEGRTFHRGAVLALAEGDGQLDQRLLALVRKELVRPDRPQFAGEDAYRFRHLLIRDAAYDALPKATRAVLHRRLAVWLEQHGDQLVELDEILGYHLEQAARYQAELGHSDAQLCEQAAAHLAAAGRDALARGDERAAAGLLERALVLTRPLLLDVHLELDLARAIWTRPREAGALAAAAAERAAATGDAAGEALALAVAAFHEETVEKQPTGRLEARARAALPLLERAGDHAGLAEVWHVLGFGVANMRGHWAEQAHAEEQALLHARRAGRPWHPAGFSVPLVLGSVPAAEALERLDQLVPAPKPGTLAVRAWLLGMLDRIEEAQSLALHADERLREQSGRHHALWTLAEIDVLAGNLDEAARRLHISCEWLEEDENYSFLSTLAPSLGRVLCALGRHDDAEPLARRGRELGGEEDAVTQTLWRQVQALVCSARGQHAEAERLAREAVAISARTDGLQLQGDALCDLAEVLEAAGRRDEAAAALLDALDRYERKHIIPLARRVRERLGALRETPA